MSRRLAAGDEKGAASAQARGIQLALLLTIPCVAGAMAIPDLIMRALFARGAFTVADAAAAGATLAAYSIGLLPFVLMRSFTAPFYARGDTATPVKAALLAAAVNMLLKVLLMGHLAQVGLALATSVGAWINLSLLAMFARRQGFAVSGAAIGKPVAKLIVAGAILAAVLVAGAYGLEQAPRRAWPTSARRPCSRCSALRRDRLWLGGAVAARPTVAAWPVARGDGRCRRAAPPTSNERRPDRRNSPSLPDSDPPPQGLASTGGRSARPRPASMARPKKIAPTRANRSGESVARKRDAPLGFSCIAEACAATSASATAAAVVSAESTMATSSPTTSRIAAASTGKCVQPSTSVSGAEGPSNNGARYGAAAASVTGELGPAFLGQRHEHLAGLLHHLDARHQAHGWRGHRRRPSPCLRWRSRRCADCGSRRRRRARQARSRRSPGPAPAPRATGASATADAVLQATTSIFTPCVEQETRRLERIGLHRLGALGAVGQARGVAEIDEALVTAAGPSARAARSGRPCRSRTPRSAGDHPASTPPKVSK